jgi:hypothetical protein
LRFASPGRSGFAFLVRPVDISGALSALAEKNGIMAHRIVAQRRDAPGNAVQVGMDESKPGPDYPQGRQMAGVPCAGPGFQRGAVVLVKSPEDAVRIVTKFVADSESTTPSRSVCCLSRGSCDVPSARGPFIQPRETAEIGGLAEQC